MFKLFLVCALCAVTASAEDCVVPYGNKDNWRIFWPLVYKENGDLFESSVIDENKAVILPPGKAAILSCGPNYLRNYSRTESLKVTCKQDGKFLADNEAVTKDVNSFRCDLRAIEEVLAPVQGCPGKMASVQFGLVDPIDNAGHITGEACFSTEDGRTLFAHVRKGDKQFTTLTTVEKSFFRKPHPDTRYKTDFFKAFHLDEFNSRLRLVLGTKQIPDYKFAKFITSKYLWNDQLVATKKLVWNYYVQHSNLFNLDILEEDITSIKDNVDIFKGSHGVVKLKNASGDKVPIYLSFEKYPIPEVIWIAIKKGNKATAFAVLNDPTLTLEEVQNLKLCNSKCEAISWLKNPIENPTSYTSIKHGAVFCCEYNELRQTLTEMPPLNDVEGMYV